MALKRITEVTIISSSEATETPYTFIEHDGSFYRIGSEDFQKVFLGGVFRDLEAIIAEDFSPSSTYDVGDLAIYDNKLYECTTEITVAGSWDSTKWTELDLATKITTDKSLALRDRPADAKTVGDAIASTALTIIDPNNDGHLEFVPLGEEWSDEFLEDSVVEATENWLEEHVSSGDIVVDNTLSISGAAADAKVTGDEIAGLKEDLTIDQDAFGLYHDNTKTAVIDNTTILSDVINGVFNLTRYIRQKTVYSASSSGISTSVSTGAVTVEYGIPVKANTTYAFFNIYGYLSFCMYEDGTYERISTAGTTDLTGSFTPTKNGVVYITLISSDGGLHPTPNKTHCFIKSGTAYIFDPQAEEFVLSAYIDRDYLAFNTIDTGCISFDAVQFLKSSNFVSDNCAYNKTNGCVLLQYFSSGNCSYYKKPIRIKANHTYYYKHLYGFFTHIVYDDGTIETLTTSTTTDLSGSFTPSKDGWIYITASNTVTHPQFSNNVLLPYYVEGVYSLDKVEVVIDVNGNGDFTSLTEGLAYAVELTGAHVYVATGTYDIISEYESLYGSSFFTNFDSTTSNVGIVLKNGVTVDFAPNTYVTCEYTGNNTYVQNRFSPFNCGENGFTVRNLNLTDKNVRYSVHDERGSATDQYINKFESCVFDHDKGTGAGYIQTIGGGLGKNGYVVFDGCIIKSKNSTDRIFSYHNSGTAGARSNLLIKNCIIEGGIRFSYYGTSTLISTMIVTNCQMKSEPLVTQETSSMTTVNVEIKSWNNDIVS